MPRRHMNAQVVELTHPFQQVTVPLVQPRIRDYLIRLAIVDEVDNEGEQCQVCELRGARIECNVYARDMDGNPLYGDVCTECVLPMVDETWDTDPARVVLVERIPTRLATQRGYRS